MSGKACINRKYNNWVNHVSFISFIMLSSWITGKKQSEKGSSWIMLVINEDFKRKIEISEEVLNVSVLYLFRLKRNLAYPNILPLVALFNRTVSSELKSQYCKGKHLFAFGWQFDHWTYSKWEYNTNLDTIPHSTNEFD